MYPDVVPYFSVSLQLQCLHVVCHFSGSPFPSVIAVKSLKANRMARGILFCDQIVSNYQNLAKPRRHVNNIRKWKCGRIIPCCNTGMARQGFPIFSQPRPLLASLTTLPSLVFMITDFTVAVVYIKLKLTIICDRTWNKYIVINEITRPDNTRLKPVVFHLEAALTSMHPCIDVSAKHQSSQPWWIFSGVCSANTVSTVQPFWTSHTVLAWLHQSGKKRVLTASLVNGQQVRLLSTIFACLHSFTNENCRMWFFSSLLTALLRSFSLAFDWNYLLEQPKHLALYVSLYFFSRLRLQNTRDMGQCSFVTAELCFNFCHKHIVEQQGFLDLAVHLTSS